MEAITKKDLESLEGNILRELGRFSTKEDAKQFATKEDLKQFATKEDISDLERRTRRMAVEISIIKGGMFDLKNSLLEAMMATADRILSSQDKSAARLESNNRDVILHGNKLTRHQDILDHH
ncbi:MAG: hypothetical protein HY921_09300 [Elusimicrobia bacterium]|nr:hypothetical protein [Elusimicrobiota bacterium]